MVLRGAVTPLKENIEEQHHDELLQVLRWLSSYCVATHKFGARAIATTCIRRLMWIVVLADVPVLILHRKKRVSFSMFDCGFDQGHALQIYRAHVI